MREELLDMFSTTERVIESCSVTADQLHDYALNLEKIRALLDELARLCLKEPGTWGVRVLADRCCDLEGRVKELRNDLRRRQTQQQED